MFASDMLTHVDPSFRSGWLTISERGCFQPHAGLINGASLIDFLSSAACQKILDVLPDCLQSSDLFLNRTNLCTSSAPNRLTERRPVTTGLGLQTFDFCK